MITTVAEKNNLQEDYPSLLLVSVFEGGREIPSLKFVEIVGDRVAVKV
jgi:hypothetical protein